MKLLMRSILFGMARRDPFWDDAQADPPDRQRRQSGQPWTRKGQAVVTANPVRQPVLGERAGKPPLRRRDRAIDQAVTPQRVPTAAVPQRQWIAIHAVARPKLALEIGRPHLVD